MKDQSRTGGGVAFYNTLCLRKPVALKASWYVENESTQPVHTRPASGEKEGQVCCGVHWPFCACCDVLERIRKNRKNKGCKKLNSA